MTRHLIPKLGDDPASPFPDPARCDHPDGLLAWGGGLEPERLLNAYRQGIFPWFEPDSPILWWSPEPRAVLLPGGLHISRRLARTLRQGNFEARTDTCFETVINACAGKRRNQSGTWITADMQQAFCELHRLGHAHSIEVFSDEQLVGGLYGLAIGRVFFAESKFHWRRDASKVALAIAMRALEGWGYELMDCQIWNPHLERLGVSVLSGEHFRQALKTCVMKAPLADAWQPKPGGVEFSHW